MIRKAGGVFRGLDLDALQGMANFLGFDYPDGLSMQIQQIVGVTVTLLEGKLPDSTRLGDVLGTEVADMPSRRYQQLVDFLAGFCFRIRWGHGRTCLWVVIPTL